MPQTLSKAKGDGARRRPFIHAYAIPIRLPEFVVPGVIHPDLEDSMVAASVAPPSFEQRKHSAYHFGALSKILVRFMTSNIFGPPVSSSGDHFLEGATFAASPAYIRAKEEMLNDRIISRCIGGKDTPCIRVTPAVSDRIPNILVSEIDYDNAFRTLTYTLCRLRSTEHDGPFHAELFDKEPGCTILSLLR